MQSITLPNEPKFTSIDEKTGKFEIEGCYPGYGTTPGNALRRVLLSSLSGAAITSVKIKGMDCELKHGSVAIAAITSCTNTSNPSVMLGAGLLAKKAVEKGLTVKPYVKTSLAPGSQVVTKYLEKSGLLKYLEALKFDVVGYGCTRA